MSARPVSITLLTDVDCRLCDHAKEVLGRVAEEYPLLVDEVALTSARGRELAATAGVMFAPGVLVDGAPFSFGRLSERKLRKTLAARDHLHDRGTTRSG